MKILITGGSGVLGEYLNNELINDFQVLSLYNNNQCRSTSVSTMKVDITDYDLLKEVFQSFEPAIVIHTAAFSSPAICDAAPPKTVYEVNVNATQQIAELCKKHNAKLIYISTDLVYAGYRGSMLDENAKLIPISFYAETKLMGEQKIQQVMDNFIILRTSLLFGFTLSKSENHFQKMYLSFRSNRPEKLFIDQFRTPLSFFDAASIIGELCKLELSGEIINLGGRDRVSRAQFGRMLCDIAGFEKKLIKKITMDDIQGTYKVADVSLNTDKLQSYCTKIKSLRNSIKYILDNIPFNLQ